MIKLQTCPDGVFKDEDLKCEVIGEVEKLLRYSKERNVCFDDLRAPCAVLVALDDKLAKQAEVVMQKMTLLANHRVRSDSNQDLLEQINWVDSWPSAELIIRAEASTQELEDVRASQIAQELIRSGTKSARVYIKAAQDLLATAMSSAESGTATKTDLLAALTALESKLQFAASSLTSNCPVKGCDKMECCEKRVVWVSMCDGHSRCAKALYQRTGNCLPAAFIARWISEHGVSAEPWEVREGRVSSASEKLKRREISDEFKRAPDVVQRVEQSLAAKEGAQAASAVHATAKKHRSKA